MRRNALIQATKEFFAMMKVIIVAILIILLKIMEWVIPVALVLGVILFHNFPSMSLLLIAILLKVLVHNKESK